MIISRFVLLLYSFQLNAKGSIIPFYIDYGLSGFCKGKELNVKSHAGGRVKLKMEADMFMEKFPHYPPECARGDCTSMVRLNGVA